MPVSRSGIDENDKFSLDTNDKKCYLYVDNNRQRIFLQRSNAKESDRIYFGRLYAAQVSEHSKQLAAKRVDESHAVANQSLDIRITSSFKKVDTGLNSNRFLSCVRVWKNWDEISYPQDYTGHEVGYPNLNTIHQETYVGQFKDNFKPYRISQNGIYIAGQNLVLGS